jgi:hypothetical protein
MAGCGRGETVVPIKLPGAPVALTFQNEALCFFTWMTKFIREAWQHSISSGGAVHEKICDLAHCDYVWFGAGLRLW